MTDYSNRRRNPNDIMTDEAALGPMGPMVTIKTADGTYNEPGLPTPPAGYGKKLTLSEEGMEPMYPDLNDND